MPQNTITCPHCRATLKPARPVAEGARVKCSKCKTAFTAGEDAAEAVQPKPPAPSRAANKPKPKAAPGTEEVDDEDAADEEDDEDSGRRKSKKGGKGVFAAIPVWGWLVGGGVGLFLLCGCTGCAGLLLTGGGGLGGLGNTVTQENLGKIKMKMTEAEVIQILGKPTSLKTQGFGKVDRWDSGGDFIEIEFDGDRAVYRKFSFTSNDGIVTKKNSGEGGLW